MSVSISILGCIFGSLSVFFLARTDLIIFKPGQAIGGITGNYCELLNYPKEQDYFWYLALVAGSVASSLLFSCLYHRGNSRTDKKGPTRISWLVLHIASSLALFGLLLTESWASSAISASLLAISGASLAVFSLQSNRFGGYPAETGSIPGLSLGLRDLLLALLVAVLWFADPELARRPFDNIHEGVHLNYFQSFSVGDITGLKIFGEYSPLYTNSVNWWLKYTAPTVKMLRWYFFGVQVFGTTILLALLFGITHSVLLRLLGTAAILLQTSASPVFLYGWANTTRIALPLLAWFLLWKSASRGSLRRTVLAGLVSGIALTYSMEFAVAGLIASLPLLPLSPSLPGSNPGNRARLSLAWGIAILAGFIFTMLVIYQGSILPAISGLFGRSYMASRLGGHASRPLPHFLFHDSPVRLIGDAGSLAWSFFLWIPGFMAALSLATLIGARMKGRTSGTVPVLGLAIFALVAQMPAIARPMGIPASTFPPTILLAILTMREVSGNYSRRNPAFIAMGTLLVLGILAGPFWNRHIPPRFFQMPQTTVGKHPEIPRLGGIEISRQNAELFSRSIRIIQDHCAARGEYIFITDAFNLALPFFADRPAMPPYPETFLASTPGQRLSVMTALEKYRPRLAIIGILGLDVPFNLQFPEQWKYISNHYRPLIQVDNTAFYIRKGENGGR